MDKPEDYKSAPRQIREEATWLINSFGHDLSLLEGSIAAAILSAQSQAYIDAARIADGYADEQKKAWDAFVASGARGPATSYESLYRGISAAILQRKEEIGRN